MLADHVLPSTNTNTTADGLTVKLGVLTTASGAPFGIQIASARFIRGIKIQL